MERDEEATHLRNSTFAAWRLCARTSSTQKIPLFFAALGDLCDSAVNSLHPRNHESCRSSESFAHPIT